MRCSLLVCVFTCLWCPIAHGDLLDTYQNDIKDVLGGEHARILGEGYIETTYQGRTRQAFDAYIAQARKYKRTRQRFDAPAAVQEILGPNCSPGGLLVTILAALNSDRFRDCVAELCCLARSLFENAELVRVAVPLAAFKQHLCYIAAEDTRSRHAERPLQRRPQAEAEPPAEPQPIFEPQQLENLTNAGYRCLFEDLHLIAKNKELIPLLCNHPQLQMTQEGEYITTIPIGPALSDFYAAEVHVSCVTNSGRHVKLRDLDRMAKFWVSSTAIQTPLVFLYCGDSSAVLSQALETLLVRTKERRTIYAPPAHILIARDETYQEFEKIALADRFWPRNLQIHPIAKDNSASDNAQALARKQNAAQEPMKLNLTATICTHATDLGHAGGRIFVRQGLVTVDAAGAETINQQETARTVAYLTDIVSNAVNLSRDGQATVAITHPSRSAAWQLILQQITDALNAKCPKNYDRIHLVGLSTPDPASRPTPGGIWNCGVYYPTCRPDVVSVLCGGNLTLQLQVYLLLEHRGCQVA
jgi:hypothetical protein